IAATAITAGPTSATGSNPISPGHPDSLAVTGYERADGLIYTSWNDTGTFTDIAWHFSNIDRHRQ
ncbi:hypothetical protein AB4084_41805, partial [Lysobacter sp. 2RAB21]